MWSDTLPIDLEEVEARDEFDPTFTVKFWGDIVMLQFLTPQKSEPKMHLGSGSMESKESGTPDLLGSRYRGGSHSNGLILFTIK